MGTYIGGICQKKNGQGAYEEVDSGEFFDICSYNIYAWLAGVRNYSEIEPLSVPRELPEDYIAECKKKVSSDDEHTWGFYSFYRREWNDHLWETSSHSWLMVDEILSADFDKIVEDRRVAGSGRVCPRGEGNFEPLREYLGEDFIESVRQLKERGVDRIIFWFK